MLAELFAAVGMGTQECSCLCREIAHRLLHKSENILNIMTLSTHRGDLGACLLYTGT